MSTLESLIGKPIRQFSEDRLPTVRDVLRFYAQYWGAQGSDSKKEKYVMDGLIQLYQQKGIFVLTEKAIKYKISKQIKDLKKIIKFSSKVKTEANIVQESEFVRKLDEIFEITRAVQMEEFETDDTSMETDSFNGVYLENNLFEICTPDLFTKEYQNRLRFNIVRICL